MEQAGGVQQLKWSGLGVFSSSAAGDAALGELRMDPPGVLFL